MTFPQKLSQDEIQAYQVYKMSEVLNGAYVSYHSNGNIREKGTYIDGMLQGVFHEYDEDGKLIVQSYWKDHKLHGKFTHWRDVSTGVLLETAYYSNDIKLYSSVFDENSMIAGNYYFEVIDGVNKCVKSVEYKRLKNGGCIVATTIPGYYSEELVGGTARQPSSPALETP